MAWLSRLDAHAARWPRPLFWPYQCLKWLLVVLGLYGAIGLCVMELRERRVGLGTGIVTVILFTYLPKGWRLLTSRRA